jgi:hypothetical protein
MLNILRRNGMRIKYLVLIGLGIVSLLGTSSLALYYRHQAAYFEREWSAVVKQLGAEPATSAEPILRNASAPQMNANNAELSQTRRQEPAQQPAEKEKLALASTVTPPPVSSDPNPPRRRGADWLENLRTSDPKRYEEIQQRRQEMQQRAQDAWVQGTNYFMNRDTSKMSDPEMEEYNKMVTLLSQTRELSQQLQSDVPPEVRREIMFNVRSNMTALTPLLNNERNREYYDLAVNMGHSEEDAGTIVEYINQITSNTSLRVILPGIMRGRGPDDRPRENTPVTIRPAN